MAVKVGDFIKFRFGNERMWTEVLSLEPDDRVHVALRNRPSIKGNPEYDSRHTLFLEQAVDYEAAEGVK